MPIKIDACRFAGTLLRRHQAGVVAPSISAERIAVARMILSARSTFKIGASPILLT
ncbi:MAG: hypothetical protein ACYC5H_01170 [Methylovirgula sp.]